MKTCWRVCNLPCSGTFAIKAILSHSFHTLYALRHFPQLVGRALSQPKAITWIAVNKLLRTIPRFEPFFGSRFFCNEVLHRFLSEKIVPAIYRLVSNANFRNVADRLISAFHKNVVSIQKIAIDVFRNLGTIRRKNHFRFVIGCCAEPYDHTMNVGLNFCFTVPAKGAVGKVNMNTGEKQRLPQVCDGFALGHRVCRNQCGTDGCADHQISCFLIPTGNIV